LFNSGSRVNIPKFKKLNNGKIVKQIDEQYLRNDVDCGYDIYGGDSVLELNLKGKKASRDV
jgi:hypothetical protein